MGWLSSRKMRSRGGRKGLTDRPKGCGEGREIERNFLDGESGLICEVERRWLARCLGQRRVRSQRGVGASAGLWGDRDWANGPRAKPVRPECMHSHSRPRPTPLMPSRSVLPRPDITCQVISVPRTLGCDHIDAYAALRRSGLRRWLTGPATRSRRLRSGRDTA